MLRVAVIPVNFMAIHEAVKQGKSEREIEKWESCITVINVLHQELQNQLILNVCDERGIS